MAPLNPNTPPALWSVQFGPGVAARHTLNFLTPQMLPILFQLLGEFQQWFCVNDVGVRNTLARLTLPRNTKAKSTAFRERTEELAKWLYTEPPGIELRNLSDSFGTVARDVPGAPAFFGLSVQARRKLTRIGIAARLIEELAALDEKSTQERPPEHTIAKLNMLSFFFLRTLLHEVAHAARNIFCQHPTPPGIHGIHYHHRYIPGTLTLHNGRNAQGVQVPRGELGWEFKRLTGGEAHLSMSKKSDIAKFKGKNITGLRVEVARDVWRCISFSETDVLHKLAHVQWESISLDLSLMPATATFSNDPVLGDTIRTCHVCTSTSDTRDSEFEELGSYLGEDVSPSPSTALTASLTELQLGSVETGSADGLDGDSDSDSEVGWIWKNNLDWSDGKAPVAEEAVETAQAMGSALFKLIEDSDSEGDDSARSDGEAHFGGEKIFLLPRICGT
ncbi:hypothetical protein C8F01DRAFT_1163346 [Mycena amicta]|nr:hypothetical protein C8F01DRAFT_1163346 [Mycena amicta]